MNFVRKLFHIPGPKELGRSETDALEMRSFSPFTKAYTWEDWDEEVSRAYPVRWFITQTVPELLRPIRRAARRLRSWLKYGVLRRYHKLDLRTPEYRYGYLDPCEALRLACWACLVSYVEEHSPSDPTEGIPASRRSDPDVAERKRVYDELMALYHWWKEGRHEEEREEEVAREAMEMAVTAGDEPQYSEAKRRWLSMHERHERRAEERLRRLVELRAHLWT